MATLIYRRKCSKPGPHCHSGSANGAAACFHSPSAPCVEHHEMECLPRHLDTKVSCSSPHIDDDLHILRLYVMQRVTIGIFDVRGMENVK